MTNIMAVDVGFGRVKALLAEQQLEFPSVIGLWREIRFKRSDQTTTGFLPWMYV